MSKPRADEVDQGNARASYFDPLDMQRLTSMAHEGGRSGAVMEVQDVQHNERLLQHRSAPARWVRSAVITALVGGSILAAAAMLMTSRTPVSRAKPRPTTKRRPARRSRQ